MATAEPTLAEVWREPVRGGYPDPRVVGLSGRERLGSFRLGKSAFPPLFHLTGARPTRFGDGTADAEMPATGWLLGPGGLIGGGTLAILADIVFGCAIETELPPATPYTTAELSLSFLRPAAAGGVLTASGQAIHVGRRVALSEAFLFGADGETLIAHGTSRCAVLPQLEPVPPPPTDLADVAPPAYEGPDPYLREAALDGVIPDEAWEQLPGQDLLARLIAGELPPPPIERLTGIRLVEARDGRATMVLPANEWLASPLRLLQGGTIAMLADAALLSAVLTGTGPGIFVAGLDLKVNYLRPAPPDGRDLVARAEILHAGRTIAVARASVENADGKPVVLATGSAMLVGARPVPSLDGELGPTEPA